MLLPCLFQNSRALLRTYSYACRTLHSCSRSSQFQQIVHEYDIGIPLRYLFPESSSPTSRGPFRLHEPQLTLNTLHIYPRICNLAKRKICTVPHTHMAFLIFGEAFIQRLALAGDVFGTWRRFWTWGVELRILLQDGRKAIQDGPYREKSKVEWRKSFVTDVER